MTLRSGSHLRPRCRPPQEAALLLGKAPVGQELARIRKLRLAAARAGREDLLPFYGGQSALLASPCSAANLMEALVEETDAAFGGAN